MLALGLGLGVTRGNGGAPIWVPAVGGTLASLYADFDKQRYWENRQVYSDLAGWVAAGGGSAFSRSSSATYFDGSLVQTASSNVARFHTIPGTSNRGILIEAAATNVVLWNRDLTNAAWTASNVTVVKDQTGADGVANSASSLTATAANGTVLQAITLASSARAQSAWVKRLTGTGTINMTMDNGSTWTAIVPTASWSPLDIPTQTLANPTVGFRIVTSGDAIAVDFVQNENRDYRTTPIATTTVSVTRAADVLSYANGGSIINATEGTLFAEWVTPLKGAATFFPRVLSLHKASDSLNQNVFLYHRRNGSDFALCDVSNGSGGSSASLTLGTYVFGSVSKMAGAYKLDDYAGCFNGGTVQTDTSGALPVGLDEFGIGHRIGSNQLDGIVKRIGYWQSRLANAQLQALTA